MGKLRVKEPALGAKHIAAPPSDDPVLDAPEKPVICLRFLAKGFSDEDIKDKDELSAFLKSLCRASRQTWLELTTRSHKGGGIETIGVSQLQVGRPKQFDGQSSFVSLRASQRSRVIGFRRQGMFHVVWLDHLHQVYKG